MNEKNLDAIKDAFLECMDSVYSASCWQEFDDGDMLSHNGWVSDADNLRDLCASFAEWVMQIDINNTETD